MARPSFFDECGADQPWQIIEDLVRTVGEPQFKDALLNTLDRTLMVSDCVAFVARNGQLSSAFEVSQSNSTQLTSLVGHYLRHFPDRGRRLPFRKLRVPYRKVQCNVIGDVGEVETPSFRRNFYGEGNFVDQAWSLTRHQDGFVALCVFRRGKQGKFREDQADQFAQLAPIFLPFISRHISSLPALNATSTTLPLDLATEVMAATASLAPREIEVCARILHGLTSEGIALDLNTSIHTVRTHRKRAYRKLQISSMAELFSRAFACERMAVSCALAHPAS